ncbi:MAG: response regulator [Deltaproteobacteria bacterium]|nr:response regulator [Deltaproteobacteria bacterium]
MVKDARHESTVLVIDDEESMREGCRQTLEEEGYRAAVARDGEAGLHLVKELKPNIVLIDLKMPRVSGIEVLVKVREIDPDIVSIVITGYGTVESAVKTMKIGAFDYLCKPFDDKALLEAVGRGMQFEHEQENGIQTQNTKVIIEILERASDDVRFIVQLTEEGSKALEGYGLTWEEKAAIACGDIQWIEKRVGKLSEKQKTWLNCRLQQERW